MWSLTLIKENWSNARDSSSGVPTDVTIQVKEENGDIYQVKAHKYYLSLVSPVFKAIFFGPLGRNEDTVTIDAPVEAVKAMISHIYLEEICWEKKSLEEIIEIALLADFYDVVGMIQVVKKAVEKVPIALDNVVVTAHFSETISILDEVSQLLLSKCTKFLSQVMCRHVLDFSGLFSESKFASSAAKLHSLVLEVDLPNCSNCDHFPCMHGQLVPHEGWDATAEVGDDGWTLDQDVPCVPPGCLLTDEDGIHWTVFGYQPGLIFFNNESEGDLVIFVRKTTFNTDGNPHLHEGDDRNFVLGDDAVYFDCQKLGEPVKYHLLPDEDAMSF